MHLMKSELTGRFYVVRPDYKPGRVKHDVTAEVNALITAERERIIALLDWLNTDSTVALVSEYQSVEEEVLDETKIRAFLQPK